MSFPDKNSHSNVLTWLYGSLYPSRRAAELITSPIVFSQLCKVHSYSEKIIRHATIVTKTISITRVTSLICHGEIWLVPPTFRWHQTFLYWDSPDPIFLGSGATRLMFTRNLDIWMPTLQESAFHASEMEYGCNASDPYTCVRITCITVLRAFLNDMQLQLSLRKALKWLGMYHARSLWQQYRWHYHAPYYR